ncbi:MAG: hypothetical protein C5B51_02495 [Terriglobia bacterium]|nr:MAG: hypothetical protein C5B51_02495 [Terriglobia bacterium]
MATLEICLDEELEQLLAEQSLSSAAVEANELEMLSFEPWKQGSDPETAAGAEWLFEVLMA